MHSLTVLFSFSEHCHVNMEINAMFQNEPPVGDLIMALPIQCSSLSLPVGRESEERLFFRRIECSGCFVGLKGPRAMSLFPISSENVSSDTGCLHHGNCTSFGERARTDREEGMGSFLVRHRISSRLVWDAVVRKEIRILNSTESLPRSCRKLSQNLEQEGKLRVIFSGAIFTT